LGICYWALAIGFWQIANGQKPTASSINNCSMSKLPESLSKRYYGISEVAAMFGVTTSLVRYWEQQFDFLRPSKSGKGERRFTPDNLRQFDAIYHLVKEQGYTLAGAKRYLKEEKDKMRQKQDALKTLKRLRGFLEDLKIKG
jgi:DNA-binding transcriptional MerR regulator